MTKTRFSAFVALLSLALAFFPAPAVAPAPSDCCSNGDCSGESYCSGYSSPCNLLRRRSAPHQPLPFATGASDQLGGDGQQQQHRPGLLPPDAGAAGGTGRLRALNNGYCECNCGGLYPACTPCASGNNYLSSLNQDSLGTMSPTFLNTKTTYSVTQLSYGHGPVKCVCFIFFFSDVVFFFFFLVSG
jgi:hypothetical protein